LNWREALDIQDTSSQTQGLSKTEQALAIRKAPFALANPEAAQHFFKHIEAKLRRDRRQAP
jgi:hypothetical protein